MLKSSANLIILHRCLERVANKCSKMKNELLVLAERAEITVLLVKKADWEFAAFFFCHRRNCRNCDESSEEKLCRQ